jgi:hypothetical protein
MTYGWAKRTAGLKSSHMPPREPLDPPRAAREATDVWSRQIRRDARVRGQNDTSLEDISEACWGPGRRCGAANINDGMDQGQPTSLCNIFWIYFYKTDPTNQLDGIALLCASSKNNRYIAQWGSARQAQHVALPAW